MLHTQPALAYGSHMSAIGPEMKQRDMTRDHLAVARTLSEALPYLQRFKNAIIVVKFGGNAMGDDETMTGWREPSRGAWRRADDQ
jgi:hypothetical protein